jgi:hypothetical protein
MPYGDGWLSDGGKSQRLAVLKGGVSKVVHVHKPDQKSAAENVASA